MFSLLPLFISYASGITWYYTNIPITIALIAIVIFYQYAKKYNKQNLFITSCIGILLGSTQCAYHLYTYNKNYNETVEGTYNITAKIKTIEKHPETKWPLTAIATTHIHKKITIKILSKNDLDILPDDTIYLKNIHFYEQTKESLKNYNLTNNICHTIFITKKQTTLLKRPKISIARFLHNFRANIHNAIKKKLLRKPHQLFSLLFLGKKEKTQTYNKIKADFDAWGISHYLARSGIHITLFIFALLLLLRFIPLPLCLKHSLALLLILMYSILSYQTNSSFRAYYMTILYLVSLFSHSYVHPKDIAIGSLFITLLCNPLLLFALDIQLSYGLTALLCWTIKPKK